MFSVINYLTNFGLAFCCSCPVIVGSVRMIRYEFSSSILIVCICPNPLFFSSLHVCFLSVDFVALLWFSFPYFVRSQFGRKAATPPTPRSEIYCLHTAVSCVICEYEKLPQAATLAREGGSGDEWSVVGVEVINVDWM